MSSTLLHIDVSPRSGRSHSRQIGAEFISGWQSAHPEGRVITRDLSREIPPFVSQAWVEGAFTPAESHSSEARSAISVSDGYVGEFLGADEILISTPMYNLSIPAVLKAWIDQIVRLGRTFSNENGRYAGLARTGRISVIVASGGDFRPGTPAAGYNFVESYLRAIFGFVGVQNVQFTYAHSINVNEEAREKALADARIRAREQAAA